VGSVWQKSRGGESTPHSSDAYLIKRTPISLRIPNYLDHLHYRRSGHPDVFDHLALHGSNREAVFESYDFLLATTVSSDGISDWRSCTPLS
jgi:hypothetical protein